MLFSLFVASGAAADDRALAETLFLEGKALMDAKKYGEACKRFEASHQAEPSVGALLNLARCHQLDGKLASAWREFRAAAAFAEEHNQRDRKQGALDYAAELEPRLSKMTVIVEHPIKDLVIKRADETLAPERFGEAEPVDGGTYVISASAPGHVSWRTEVIVGAEKDEHRVTVPRLEPEPSSDAPSEAPDGMHPRAIAGLALAGVGLASVVVGIAFGATAIDDERELSERCLDKRCPPDALEFRDDIEVRAHVSTATLVVGTAALAAGAVLFFTAPHGLWEEAALVVVPEIAPGVVGFGAAGRF